MATVWRLRWEMSALEHTTEWSIHYDVIRELRDEYRERWPGCGVEMESAKVSEVENVTEMNFK